MINLTNKIQMTYSSGFIVIRHLKAGKDGIETLSPALSYKHAEYARKGILHYTGADISIDKIEQARVDLIKQNGIKYGEALAKAKLAKLNKVEDK